MHYVMRCYLQPMTRMPGIDVAYCIEKIYWLSAGGEEHQTCKLIIPHKLESSMLKLTTYRKQLHYCISFRSSEIDR